MGLRKIPISRPRLIPSETFSGLRPAPIDAVRYSMIKNRANPTIVKIFFSEREKSIVYHLSTCELIRRLSHSNLITSILNSKTNAKSAGYKSDRTISLVSDPIPTEQLEMVRDIYNSPRVYLYVGSGTDTEGDWILVTVKADKSIRREKKNKFTTLQLDVTLPQTYSITML